jgi:hypothetical protein
MQLVVRASTAAFLLAAAIVLVGMKCTNPDEEVEFVCPAWGCEAKFSVSLYQDLHEPTAPAYYRVEFLLAPGTIKQVTCDYDGETALCTVYPPGSGGGEVGGHELAVTIDPLDDEGNAAPEIAVRVYVGQTLLGEETFQPEYDNYHADEGCPEPPCHEAWVSMFIDYPPE